MYIVSDIFQQCQDDTIKKDNEKLVVVFLPANNQRFQELIENCLDKINEDDATTYQLKVLSHDDSARSPSNNFKYICCADKIIAECTEKKPNVFYMVGLAHTIGKPVCACYKITATNFAIPFNVQGRQSMSYSLRTMQQQDEFTENLIAWIKS